MPNIIVGNSLRSTCLSKSEAHQSSPSVISSGFTRARTEGKCISHNTKSHGSNGIQDVNAARPEGSNPVPSAEPATFLVEPKSPWTLRCARGYRQSPTKFPAIDQQRPNSAPPANASHLPLSTQFSDLPHELLKTGIVLQDIKTKPHYSKRASSTPPKNVEAPETADGEWQPGGNVPGNGPSMSGHSDEQSDPNAPRRKDKGKAKRQGDEDEPTPSSNKRSKTSSEAIEAQFHCVFHKQYPEGDKYPSCGTRYRYVSQLK